MKQHNTLTLKQFIIRSVGVYFITLVIFVYLYSKSSQAAHYSNPNLFYSYLQYLALDSFALKKKTEEII